MGRSLFDVAAKALEFFCAPAWNGPRPARNTLLEVTSWAEVRRLRHTTILFAWQDPAISRLPHGDFLTRSRLLTAAIISSTEL